MSHILLDEYKQYKSIDLANTSEDEQLNIILAGVTNYLLEQFGIVLEQTSLLDTWYISYLTNKIFINRDVGSIISIKVNNELQKLDDYSYRNGILKKKVSNFPQNVDVDVEYTVGYQDIASIPEGIKLAIFIFADKLYEDIENNSNLISSMTDPVGGREVFKRNLPKEIKMLLSPYYYISI